MATGQIGSDEGKNGTKAYTVNLQARAQSTSSCAFCWFVVAVYPTLQGMTSRDESTYRSHLQKSHGLTFGMQA